MKKFAPWVGVECVWEFQIELWEGKRKKGGKKKNDSENSTATEEATRRRCRRRRKWTAGYLRGSAGVISGTLGFGAHALHLSVSPDGLSSYFPSFSSIHVIASKIDNRMLRLSGLLSLIILFPLSQPFLCHRFSFFFVFKLYQKLIKIKKNLKSFEPFNHAVPKN